MKHSFCEDWEFTRHWTEAFGKGLPVPKQQAVRLPHTCREVPLHYASPADYEMVCGYRKRFRVPPRLRHLPARRAPTQQRRRYRLRPGCSSALTEPLIRRWCGSTARLPGSIGAAIPALRWRSPTLWTERVKIC